jgi:dTDP-4-amino-4,6-dideoxygalactose transaminase
MASSPIYVTRPHLPPLEEVMPYLESIWESRVLTNGGSFHQQLEVELCKYLGVPHISLFCNATVALVTALQALQIKGEVITTPFSFVATAHSLLWNGLTPVFVDIDAETLNLDPRRIEEAITPKTTAILPVHVYGNPCDVDAIEAIAKKHQLKVIYDAAHAFGVNCHCGQSVLNHGDLSVLSFHATKVFNTFEGGAIISQSAEMKRRIDHLKNFGFVDETTVVECGINGKMSEFNAAIGLAQLKGIDQAIAQRAAIKTQYQQALAGIQGISFVEHSGTNSNHSYLPIRVSQQCKSTRDEIFDHLKKNNVHTRRYFYPLITDFPMYKNSRGNAPQLPQARTAASEVLCLPIYPDLASSELQRICDSICELTS